MADNGDVHGVNFVVKYPAVGIPDVCYLINNKMREVLILITMNENSRLTNGHFQPLL